MSTAVYVLSCLCSFSLGYILGRVDIVYRMIASGSGIQTESVQHTSSFVASVAREQKVEQTRKKITIDDSKFVTDVSTDGIESLSSSPLGDVTKSEDDISAASSKLAQLKRLKG